MLEQRASSFDGSYYDADYFDNAASGKGYPGIYTSQSAPWGALAQWFVKRLQPHMIVDLGAAKGYLVKEFSMRGVLALGFDFSPYAVEQAIAPVLEHDIRQPIPWTLRQPPDIAFVLDVLEHQTLYDLDEVMVTLTVLNPKIIVVHAGIRGTQDENEASHVTLLGREEWTAYFAENNFFAVAWQEEYRTWIREWGTVGQFWAERAFVLEKRKKVFRESRDVNEWLQDPWLSQNIEVIGGQKAGVT